MDRGYKLVPEGLGNCSFDLPAELCSDKSATKRNLSLTFKEKSIGAKVQVTGHRLQATGQITGHRLGYRSGHRSPKNNRTLDKTVLD